MPKVWLNLDTPELDGLGGMLLVDENRIHTWDESEHDSQLNETSKIFKTHRGTYVANDGGTTLLTEGGVPIGFLSGFRTSSAKLGDNGQGRSDETGTAFNWTVSPYDAAEAARRFSAN